MNPHIARLLILRKALYLECLGMRHSRGSAVAQVRREFGLKGSKEAIYTQFCELIEKEKGLV